MQVLILGRGGIFKHLYGEPPVMRLACRRENHEVRRHAGEEQRIDAAFTQQQVQWRGIERMIRRL